MEILGSVIQIIPSLWSPISRQIGYLKHLDDNMNALKRESDELKYKHDEIEAQVDAAVSAGMARLPRVQKWLEDVGDTVAEVDLIGLQVERLRTRCFCVDLNSRRKLGKMVIGKKNDVKELRGKGEFRKVAESPRGSHVPDQMQVPQEVEQQSSSKEILQALSQWLKDDEVGVISVWGMGGIGKTTIMKETYNRLNATKDFHQVIWVTVSKDLDLEVIQQKIGKKLQMEFHGNEDIEDKRRRLHARLRNVRYALVLDDLWQKFSLYQVGIPQPDRLNQCKILMTTRSKFVSNGMEADRQIQVKTLSSEEAWDLFCSKTGDVILSPEIRPVAEKVLDECGGLPLAIITVGAAMRNRGKKELWEDALRALRAPQVSEIPGMEREVFLSLKLSYDFLDNLQIQLCFLYCSLYPEDCEISVNDMVRYWAFEEGLIDNVDRLDAALRKGHSIIEKLKDACLLEELTNNPFDQDVRMHDLLRDLAIWITSPSSSFFQASKFLVKAGEGLEQAPEEKLWESMHRISLMYNQITGLQMIPNCPDLVSLFLSNNERLHTIGDSFFQLMPKLQILDLSFTSIKFLPHSLSLLVNLRVLDVNFCTNLIEMPPLGDLKELELLALQRTDIENLPQGIATLTKLKCLDLSHTNALATIPNNMISGLTSLEDLRLFGDAENQMMSVGTWREVATLRRLTSLRIQLPSLDAFTENDMKHPMWSSLNGFFVQFGYIDMRPRTRRFNRRVHIFDCQYFPSQSNFNRLMENAEGLLIEQCQGLESLSQVIGCDSTSLKIIQLSHIQGTKCIIDWSKVGGNKALDCLEELHLYSLTSLKVVFNGGSPTGFQQLIFISIDYCPKLTCIFTSSMFQHLHRLEMLRVTNCEEIEEIVEESPLPDKTQQRLKHLTLQNLPRLTTICSQQHILTSMQYIEMVHCPKLKNLPVLCSSIQDIAGEIQGQSAWWEGIEWEDDHSKSLYATIYKGV